MRAIEVARVDMSGASGGGGAVSSVRRARGSAPALPARTTPSSPRPSRAAASVRSLERAAAARRTGFVGESDERGAEGGAPVEGAPSLTLDGPGDTRSSTCLTDAVGEPGGGWDGANRTDAARAAGTGPPAAGVRPALGLRAPQDGLAAAPPARAGVSDAHDAPGVAPTPGAAASAQGGGGWTAGAGVEEDGGSMGV